MERALFARTEVEVERLDRANTGFWFLFLLNDDRGRDGNRKEMQTIIPVMNDVYNKCMWSLVSGESESESEYVSERLSEKLTGSVHGS